MSTGGFPIVVKKSPRPHHLFAVFVFHIADCLDGNTSFPNPSPSVATLKSKADAFAQANAKARAGGPGVVADRNAKREDLEADIDHLVDYVQGAVRAQTADPATAIAMILSAGLAVRKRGTAPKAPLAASRGSVSGEIVLVARAAGKMVVYSWEYSADEKTWIAAPQTMSARTTIAGLVPGQVYAFRFRARTPKGLGDYSDVVKLMAV
jgi:hypothetical protein